MLPIVNPYRSAGDHGGGGDAHFKHKPKKTSGFCSRATLLLVLVGLTCGTYYLHMKYFSNVQRKPSVRGSVHTYRSFSDSVKDFAADMKHDLTVLDEKKNPKPTIAPVVDMKKPVDPKIPRSPKVNTFVSTEHKENKIDQREHNTATIKQIPPKIEQFPIDMLDRIHAESNQANAVEDKVMLLAARAREAVQRPVTFKQPPATPPVQQLSLREEKETEKLNQEEHQHNQKQEVLPQQQPEQPELAKLQVEQQLHQQDQERLEQQAPAIMPEAEKEVPAAISAPVVETENVETDTDKDTANADADITQPIRDSVLEGVQIPQLPADISEEVPKLVTSEIPEVLPPTAPVAQVPDKEPNALTALRDQQLKLEELPQVPELAIPVDLTHNLTTTIAAAVVAGEQATAKALGLSLDTIHTDKDTLTDTLPTTTDALNLPEKLSPPIEGHQLAAPIQLQDTKTPPITTTNAIETENQASLTTATTTTAIDQPSSFDLPEKLKSSLITTGTNQQAPAGEQVKIDYCAGNIDPFQHIPVDTYQPPSSADFELASQWRSAVRTMVSKISKVKYGGEELRALIRSEVEALQVMRFKMFCKYA